MWIRQVPRLRRGRRVRRALSFFSLSSLVHSSLKALARECRFVVLPVDMNSH